VTLSTILTGFYAHDRDAQLNAERGAITCGDNPDNGRRRRFVLGPVLLLRTMLYDPLIRLSCKALVATYTIDIGKNHDFFVVTVSRLFYYCGISVQTFFLYFLHDIIRVKGDPESAVAFLAVLGQIAAVFICYPVGVASDRLCNGRRKPFVYLACAILSSVTLTMIFATTMQQMIILCSVLGAANGMYLTMETSLAVDTLPSDYDNGPSGGNAQLLGSK
jgi:Na+/melibiose symporter-like transporter